MSRDVRGIERSSRRIAITDISRGSGDVPHSIPRRACPNRRRDNGRGRSLLNDACFPLTALLQARLVAALAQLVEHIIRNDGVTGSSPVSGTIPSALSMALVRALARRCGRALLVERWRAPFSVWRDVPPLGAASASKQRLGRTWWRAKAVGFHLVR